MTGAAVNLRTKGDKLAVWLADSAAAEAVVGVGRLVKARLGLQDNQTIVFSVHIVDSTSRKGPRDKRRRRSHMHISLS